jgi:hypothetical protein
MHAVLCQMARTAARVAIRGANYLQEEAGRVRHEGL